MRKIKFGEREVLVGSLDDISDIGVFAPFAILLWISNQDDIDKALVLSKDLLSLGCVDFSCLGFQAEKLNDQLDEILEDLGALSVVTTWYEDSNEGCEYFLFAAGAQKLHLVALGSQNVELVNTLTLASQAE